MRTVFLSTILASQLFAFTSFQGLSERIIDATWRDLASCGLQQFDAQDPRLPRPQVPAMDAVVNSKLRVLAYTDEEYFYSSATLLFKAPNGGQRHSVYYDRDSIRVVTPYAGTVARASRVSTVNGPMEVYYCRSTQVDFATWEACVKEYFIGVISSQLCRFP